MHTPKETESGYHIDRKVSAQFACTSLYFEIPTKSKYALAIVTTGTVHMWYLLEECAAGRVF